MHDGKTRIIHLHGGQERQRGSNHETRVVHILDNPPRPDTFQELFIRHYRALRDHCADIDEPGLAVVAVDTIHRELAGTLWLAAKVDRANAAIIGRHTMADLYLERDDSLSLRHLVVLVSPLGSDGREVGFRVVDLRTQGAFLDEHGRRFESLAAEGPLFIRCGRYALLCLVTGDPTGWPESPEDGWACIPERVYLQANEAEPDRWRRWRLRWRRQPRPERGPERRAAVTQVQTMLGPVRAQQRLVNEGESPLGSLRVRVDMAKQYFLVGPGALQRGILLGRYERCDVDGSELLASESISRVHLLILEVGGRVYAVDTASTNGTWVRGSDREVRIVAMDPEVDLSLGSDLAHLRWCPA